MAQEFHLAYTALRHPTKRSARNDFFGGGVQQSYATESSLKGCHGVSLDKCFLTFLKSVLNQTIALRPKRVKISRCYSDSRKPRRTCVMIVSHWVKSLSGLPEYEAGLSTMRNWR